MALRDEIVERAFSVVLAEMGISKREILPNIRETPVVSARLAMYLALRKMGFSTPQIGKRLDRDHTTVISGVKTARKWYATKPEFKAVVDKMVGHDN